MMLLGPCVRMLVGTFVQIMLPHCVSVLLDCVLPLPHHSGRLDAHLGGVLSHDLDGARGEGSPESQPRRIRCTAAAGGWRGTSRGRGPWKGYLSNWSNDSVGYSNEVLRRGFRCWGRGVWKAHIQRPSCCSGDGKGGAGLCCCPSCGRRLGR